jgi:hypothetical protein
MAPSSVYSMIGLGSAQLRFIYSTLSPGRTQNAMSSALALPAINIASMAKTSAEDAFP